MSWYIMNKDTYDLNAPCKICKKPIKIDDKYMLHGHQPPFELSHAVCEWTKEEERQNAMRKGA